MRLIIMQVFAHIALGLWPSVKGFFDRYRKLALFLFSLIIIFMIFSLLTGCSLMQVQDAQKMAEQTYRKYLKFKVDGKEYFGVAVLPRKSSYEIKFFPETKITTYLIQTCHRDEPIDKPKTGWFSNEFEYRFLPQAGIEDQGACPLEVAALEESQKKDGFAFIEFRDVRGEISLDGNLRCNGVFEKVQGTAICQSAEGLIQEIFFNQKVLIEKAGNSCPNPESEDGFFWRLKMPKDKCSYYFTAREKHKNGERLSLRLTTIGYTASKIKE